MPRVPRELERDINSAWERFKQSHEDWEYFYPGWYLWHGTRKKRTITELKTEGFCYPLTHEAKNHIKNALKYFGKEYFLRREGKTGNRVRQMMWEVTSPSRMKIWASVGKDNACSWAQRSPEIVTLALDAVGVSRKDIDKYLSDNFGRTLAVKIKHRVPPSMTGPNVNLDVRCLESNDIEEIYECPIEEVKERLPYLGPGERPDSDIEKETGEKILERGYQKRKKVI